MRPFIMVILAVAMLVLPVSAQDDTIQVDSSEEARTAPLIFFGSGLRIMDEATGDITTWGACDTGFAPRISPTGEWIALANPDTNGINLCQLATRDVLTIASPLDVVEDYFQPAVAWSPDGTQIAWVVTDDDNAGAYQLAVYDLTTEETRILIEELPPTRYPIQLLWGESGILVVTSGMPQTVATLYDASGEILFDDLSGGINFAAYFWATDDDGKEYLGRYENYWRGMVIDPETGISLLAGGIELYSPLAPDGLGVMLADDGIDWIVNLPDDAPLVINELGEYMGDFVPYLQFDPRNIAISPDGAAFVVHDLNHFIWRDGDVMPLPESLPGHDGAGVIWGPVSHRIVYGVYSAAG